MYMRKLCGLLIYEEANSSRNYLRSFWVINFDVPSIQATNFGRFNLIYIHIAGTNFIETTAPFVIEVNSFGFFSSLESDFQCSETEMGERETVQKGEKGRQGEKLGEKGDKGRNWERRETKGETGREGRQGENLGERRESREKTHKFRFPSLCSKSIFKKQKLSCLISCRNT
jgi:hypothetical protein